VGAAAPGRLTVALVRGLRGLRGQVRIELLTDRPEDRFVVGARLYPEGGTSFLTIEEALPVADGPGWWLRFHEIRDREAADALREVYLEIDDPHDPPEPGRWLWQDLVGLAVRATDGADLGTIVEIYRTGGAEVFVVRGPRGELDVPGVIGIVTELAPEHGRMVVDLEALALDARPVEDEDYVRPRDRRPHKKPKPPRAPGSPPAASGPRAPRGGPGGPGSQAPKPRSDGSATRAPEPGPDAPAG
jgi:16S rRNA processing protein RimM